ncbi:MAG: hypothetical protein VR73_10270 [Gammaproteobacteria bacterium BRH_c0]|nr:MAG: hypothetical protein VR73_10270 [Gammaproteobacteria bacterium BRH_c0]
MEQGYWRCPDNKNLYLVDGPTFRGLPLMSGHGPYIVQYLDRLIEVLQKAWAEHPRLLVLRIELKIPKEWMGRDDVMWDGIMKRFIQSLRRKVMTDRARAKGRNGRCHDSSVRNVWTREVSTRDRDHFHGLLMVNHDAYYGLGSYDLRVPSLANIIREAWASALGLIFEQGARFVHYPENCSYFINGHGDVATFAEVFRRASYMCKERTKVYGNRQQSFGYSRK